MKSVSFGIWSISILLISSLVFSCKKANKTSPVYDFTWQSSNPYLLGEFEFASTAPKGSTFLWNFGDGDRSTESNPRHTFNKVDTYTIVLVVNGDSAHAISKNIYIGPNPEHWFFYSDAPNPHGTGDTISFTSNVLNDSIFLWDFGDGTTSSLPSPYHIYSSSGTYSVKLLINNTTLARTYYPKVTIYKDPVYTHLITGMRLWHGKEHYFEMTGKDERYNLLDKSFSFNRDNSVTISTFDYQVLWYNPDSSHGNVLFFTAGDNMDIYSGYKYVYFNYATDSISFYYRSSGGKGTVHTTEYIWNTP